MANYVPLKEQGFEELIYAFGSTIKRTFVYSFLQALYEEIELNYSRKKASKRLINAVVVNDLLDGVPKVTRR